MSLKAIVKKLGVVDVNFFASTSLPERQLLSFFQYPVTPLNG